MKKLPFLVMSFLLISCSEVDNRQQTRELPLYQTMRKKAQDNQKEIEVMIGKANNPIVKARSLQIFGFLLQYEREEDYLRATGHTKKEITKYNALIDHFLTQIQSAKIFSPSAEQTTLFVDLKKKVKRDSAKIAHYLQSFDVRYTPIQEARRQLLLQVLKFDLNEYLGNTLITEKEFDHNFTDLNQKWYEYVEGILNFDPSKPILPSKNSPF